ncbi:hypothetical protein [Sphingomonas nostoxanthinifaciens]|uniref:hypothetical protein n=1 Tax=Sphingomonas nostoxanthinifaciens TaxID=2872652 RepID=UPI001CC1D1CF|nr:hypothetical protein [Sphingomonas nostoxanthinifaciens]UAK23333.1 hypothetical protein K8P63_13100 [Sphingomonas nostoxanthinifaciens]
MTIRSRSIVATLLCGALTACGGTPTTVGGMVAAGSGEACGAPDVTTRLIAAYAPDTASLKARLHDGGHTLRADNVDTLAGGITYQIDEAHVVAAKPKRVDCTAMFAIASPAYGVTDQPSAPIRYRVETASGEPGFRVTPLDPTGRATAQAFFQRLVGKMDDTLAITDDKASANTLDAITAPAVSEDGLDQQGRR